MHYNILAKRTIKFPKDKGVLLIRGGIVSRDQLLNANDDNIIIDNITFGIARRILQLTDIYVGVESNSDFIFVKNNDEDALETAYTSDAFTIPESKKDHDEIIHHDEVENDTSSNEELEKDQDDNEFDDSEEDIIEEDKNYEESSDSNDAIIENEEIDDVEEKEDTAETEDGDLTEEKVVITRTPRSNNNHKNKKHHK